MDAEEAARLRGEQFRLRCRTRRERRLKAADVRKQCFFIVLVLLSIPLCCGHFNCRYWYIAVVASADTGILRSSQLTMPVHCGRRPCRYRYIAVGASADTSSLRSSSVPTNTGTLRSSQVPIPLCCGRRKCRYRYIAVVASAIFSVVVARGLHGYAWMDVNGHTVAEIRWRMEQKGAKTRI